MTSTCPTTPRSTAGIELDFGRLRLPRNLWQRYGELAQRALAEMEVVESGGIANEEEGRQVGHYWLRDPDAAPAAFPQAIRETWSRIERLVAAVREKQMENVLWIGIGGSGLGPQLIHDALRRPGQPPRFFFWDNTDPSGFQFSLDEIAACGGLAKTLTVVVSKSGGTPETHNGMVVAERSYGAAGLDFPAHAVAITQPGSKLAAKAGWPQGEAESKAVGAWLECLPIWEWVGGRTSLFSAVGLLPASLIGADLARLLEGARAMDRFTRSEPCQANPALQLAMAWYHAVETLGLRNMVVLPYCDRLSLLGKYLQQLVMESVGKDHKGISVFGNKGSTDQHSYVQQLREGTADFFAVFVRTLALDQDWTLSEDTTVGDFLAAFQEGTAQALYEAGRPSLRLTLERVDEFSLGALVALFERTVGFYGSLLGVNPYHQPGVEAGKKAAAGILRTQQAVVSALRSARGDERTVEELARASGAAPQLVFEMLDRLARCRRFGIVRADGEQDSLGERVFRIE